MLIFTSLASSAFFLHKTVSLSSTTGITQPFSISLSYLYSTCGCNNGRKCCEILFLAVDGTYKVKATTHVALLQSVFGSVDKIRSVCCPDPFVLGGFILFLVVKLQMEKSNIFTSALMNNKQKVQFPRAVTIINEHLMVWLLGYSRVHSQ